MRNGVERGLTSYTASNNREERADFRSLIRTIVKSMYTIGCIYEQRRIGLDYTNTQPELGFQVLYLA